MWILLCVVMLYLGWGGVVLSRLNRGYYDEPDKMTGKVQDKNQLYEFYQEEGIAATSAIVLFTIAAWPIMLVILND